MPCVKISEEEMLLAKMAVNIKQLPERRQQKSDTNSVWVYIGKKICNQHEWI